jgi:hypothetical protein
VHLLDGVPGAQRSRRPASAATAAMAGMPASAGDGWQAAAAALRSSATSGEVEAACGDLALGCRDSSSAADARRRALCAAGVLGDCTRRVSQLSALLMDGGMVDPGEPGGDEAQAGAAATAGEHADNSGSVRPLERAMDESAPRASAAAGLARQAPASSDPALLTPTGGHLPLLKAARAVLRLCRNLVAGCGPAQAAAGEAGMPAAVVHLLGAVLPRLEEGGAAWVA